MSKKPSASEPTEKLRRHVRITVDLGKLATQTMELDSFLQQTVVQVARAVEINHVKIMRYRPERGDLLLVAGTGWTPGVVGNARFPTNVRSPPGRAFQTGEPVVMADASDTPDLKISPVLKEHGIVALANVPILIDGAAWGVLEVDSTEPRDFSTDTVTFLLAASTVIGMAIQRAHTGQSEADALAASAAAAQSRELLLIEMQHRVKNNFQIILSMIEMQKRQLSDPNASRALDHITNRINAISLAHDQLNPAQGLRAVNLAVYLQALCETIEHQLEGIAINVEADDIDLLIDRAVPLGLVVNEAVTNSAKHAFDGGTGAVAVRLVAGVGRGEARLSISDNGKGIDPSHPAGSGTRLIKSLAAQIGGQVEQESSKQGTTTTLQFPIIT
jgi:two-component system, sensor histidine kinase PdtaS